MMHILIIVIRPALPVNEKPRKLSAQVNSLPRYANKQWVRHEEKPSSSRPVMGVVNVDEAEELLNVMALAFKSNDIRAPKIEPVEQPIQFDALASSIIRTCGKLN